MKGGSSRFCERCQTAVHDLSQMSEGEVRRFIRHNAGATVCVRYRSRPDGRVRFAPAPASRRVSALAVTGLLSAGCAGHGADELVDPMLDGVCSEDQALAGLCEGWGYLEPEPPAEPATLDELLDGEDEVLDVEDPDEPFAFEEDPVTEEPFDPEAPDEGCTTIVVADRPTMGAMIVVDPATREDGTKSYLRERTDRWRAWLADRKDRRDERRIKRKADRLARKG